MISSKNVNIESGNIEFNFENGNIDSKTGSNGAPVGSNGVIASPIIISRGPPTKALHSELLAELSGRFSSRNEYSRDGTSSEKARKTRSNPNFRKTAISETRSDPNFWKTAISETRSDPNFRKTAISELKISEIFGKFGKKFGIFVVFVFL